MNQHGIGGALGAAEPSDRVVVELSAYDAVAIDGAELTAERIDRACRTLTAMTRQERAALPYMHEGRVDVIGAGALVWRRVVERVGLVTGGRVCTAIASEHDILDGIALSQVG